MTKNDAGEEQPRGNEEQSKWNERQEEARGGAGKKQEPTKARIDPGIPRKRKKKRDRKEDRTGETERKRSIRN